MDDTTTKEQEKFSAAAEEAANNNVDGLAGAPIERNRQASIESRPPVDRRVRIQKDGAILVE